MNHPTSTLSEVVRSELDKAGYLTDQGALTRSFERDTGLSRATVARRIASDDLTLPQLRAISSLLGVKLSTLVAQSEDAA